MHNRRAGQFKWVKNEHVRAGYASRGLQLHPHKLSTDGYTDIVCNEWVIPLILLEKCTHDGKLRQDWIRGIDRQLIHSSVH
ncbi:hypothetical protein THL1_5713 [Pseudomonas sp. TCU-HL1]|nr:hypothetical protein THL1_5713 [Pseudomonas sp. TCU-HL1]